MNDVKLTEATSAQHERTEMWASSVQVVQGVGMSSVLACAMRIRAKVRVQVVGNYQFQHMSTKCAQSVTKSLNIKYL